MARDYFSYSVVRPDATVNSTGDSFLTSLKDVEWEVEKINNAGTAIPGITVYLSRTGNNAVSNFITGANGVIEFWAEPGEYIVRITDPASRIGTKEIVWNSLPAQDGSIPGTVISSESGEQLVGSQITDTTITSNDLASNSVITSKIADDAVTNAKIATNAVNADSLDPSVSIPVGSMMPYAGSTAPNAQWLLCDGSAISRSTYASLFSVIGTSYGQGNNSTTFNIPDLRGRMPIGAGTGAGEGSTGTGVTSGTALTARAIGQWGGNEKHLLTSGQLPTHHHSGTTVNAGKHSHGGSTQNGGNHSHSGTTNGATHSHGLSIGGIYHSAGGTYNAITVAGGNNYTLFRQDIGVTNDGNHTHSFGTSEHTGHSHTITEQADHSHDFTSTSGTYGNESHNNVQPFLVTNYIIRAT